MRIILPYQDYDISPQPFQGIRIRIELPALIGKLCLAQAAEPSGEIVFTVFQTQLRIEHMIVQAVDADFAKYTYEFGEIMNHVMSGENKSFRSHEVKLLILRTIDVSLCRSQMLLQDLHKFLSEVGDAGKLDYIDAP